MDLCDLAPSYIRSIAPYQPGKPIAELARELGLAESGIIKLASNENPIGVSPLAQRAIDPAAIVLGNGSNDVLELAARAFLTPELEAIYAQHAFAVYPLAVQATGARGVEVAARDFGHDLGAMRAAMTKRTRVVFVANPNNPTGT